MAEQGRPVFTEPGGYGRLAKGGGREIQRFAGQVEDAPLLGYEDLCSQVKKGSHGLLGIHVVALHEPPGLVGSDGQDGRVQRAELCPVFSESAKVSRVSGEEDLSPLPLDEPGSPQAPIGITRGTLRPMLGREEAKRGSFMGEFLEPVQFFYARAGKICGEPILVAERGQVKGIRSEEAETFFVQVVVMAVGDEHDLRAR